MAYTTGTAANYKDLLAQLSIFIAANGGIILGQTATQLYVKLLGNEGLDEIYFGINVFEDSAIGYYNWDIRGSVAWRSEKGFGYQLMPSPPIYAQLWNSPIPYWFVITGRRVIVVAKISTTYQTMHMGLMTPCGTEQQFPYPLCIGGSYTIAATQYSSTALVPFWLESGTHTGYCRMPDGVWDPISSATNAAIWAFKAMCRMIPPHLEYTDKLIRAPDGTYLLEQLFMISGQQPGIYSYIEGLFRVSGYENTAENIITVADKNYLVIPAIYRTAINNYAALRLD